MERINFNSSKLTEFLDNLNPNNSGIFFSLIIHLTILLFAVGIPNIFEPKNIYVPNINYFGEDSFTFIASDGSLNSNEASIYITVLEPLNNPPVANDDNFEIVN